MGTSKADWEAVNAALGRVIASVPESTVMDVYNSVSSVTDPGVPAYLKSLVNGADADAAYSAFLTFKDVVKKNQVASAGASATVPSGDKIGEAAKKAFGCFLPILEGNRLDLRPLHEATPWCFSFSGPEGRGQGDRDGKCHGWKPPQGS